MRKSTSEKIQAELEKKEQIQNEIKRLMQRQKDEERKARTKRLIERGAIAESFIENPIEITNDKFKQIIYEALTAYKKAYPSRINLRNPAEKEIVNIVSATLE